MEETVGYQVKRHSFDKIIHDLEREDMVQRDRGTLFELLVTAYLKKEPMYARLFDEVWMLYDVPEEYGIPRKDLGVDLVARKRETGELVAIQCKYYSKDTTIQKSYIDSFLNEVGKSYYTEGIIVTSTDKWSSNADEALLNRDKNIARIGLSQLRDSEIDWSQFSFEKPKEIKLKSPKQPRSHQIPAIEAVVNGFENDDRGKLIMAPGTGKTYTSMVIAERMAEKKNGTYRVLYLVPSIQLLSQSLRGWTADSKYREDMDTFALCSDRKVTKRTKGENEFEDIAAADLGYPATTDYRKLLERQKVIESDNHQSKLLVVFSTYQSIDVIIEAQKKGFYEFDLVICDEAHRTTGAKELNAEESAFTKVHSNDNIKAAKRLYQTATPRVYGEDAKKKAEEKSIVIADMNDPEIYGEEFYRLGFGDAIRQDILTDYKVMILAVDEKVVAKRFQKMLANEKELHFDDVTKIIGCWNGLVKRKSNSDEVEGKPMKRAIAFTGTIKESKLITKMFQQVVEEYLYETNNVFSVDIKHADGSMNALQKNQKIAWLKSEVPENTCRILSNARFLTEGVDVPELDAVMFLKPRRSKIDIAQAVGRVMRKAPGKDYGYIILPIGIPEGVDENSVLDDNKTYSVVWEVLNALRSLDERFDSMINKLELNKKKPTLIGTSSVGDAPKDGLKKPEEYQMEWELDFSELSEVEKAIYGKLVRKVGNVRYWEDWSKDVAKIAQQHMMRIKVMLENHDSVEYKEFQKYLKSLRYNLNDSISEEQAIEMLAQHMITKPVFEALFESYEFIKKNPVSKSMEDMIEILVENGLTKEQEQLESFYESVRIRAEGVDNLEGKQKIIIQLYEKFFKVAFNETTERLGIVFTPVEVVDFIIHSVEDVLKKHFGKSLASEGVHVLDPFTGTGTFIVRLLQSGIISKEDLLRKYTQEFHANEMILLSYYIAAINIEETYHSIMGGDYVPFEGIVLTDTFESTERKENPVFEIFDENNERIKRQQEQPIFAIIGNPPYSVGQTSVNDDNQNVNYPILEAKIEDTYSKYSKAKLKKSLNDTYIKAFRWASDRIEDKGVISFITNAGFIDSQSADGLRKCWHEEFNYIYIFNLRGDQKRTSGDQSRREGGKIFGSGSRTPTAITVLVKDGSVNHEIYYSDIGDYLSREQKLSILSDLKSISNVEWTKIIPDANNDWINQRDESYQKFLPLFDGKLPDKGIFKSQFTGVVPARDNWIVGFSKTQVSKNAGLLIDNYNSELDRLSMVSDPTERYSLANKSESYIKWSAKLNDMFKKSKPLNKTGKVVPILHRPFTKKWLYWDDYLNERPSSYRNITDLMDKVLYMQGAGSKLEYSCLVVDCLPNFQLILNGKGFPLYSGEDSFGLISNINESFLKKINLSIDEALYFIYGVLHSKEYKTKHSNDLVKDFPRIPKLKNKEKFIEVGRKLVDLHLNYEKIPVFDGVTIESKKNPSYKVIKMKHPKKGQTDTIIFNHDITIKNIPEKAYEYVVNGKPAIQWIMEQYQEKTDSKSGIKDDPNLYSDDEKYIFNLLLRVINVSVQTVDLINNLPPLEIIE